MEKLLKKINLFKKIDKNYFLLTLIFILGFVLRFYQLGQVPSVFNRDEPAIGYNAYSILKTGKDEWGIRLPLTFKSFGDYKSPFYIYLTVIPIALFGLTEFSVRFWAALAGSFTVLISYFLSKELFRGNNKNYKNNKNKINYSALLPSFVLAVVPWHIFFSRFSYEANLALFFNVCLLYLLIKNNFKKINLAALFLFLLTFFTYSTSLIIWPLFLIIMCSFLFIKIIQKREIKSNYKLILTFIALFILIGLIYKNQLSIGVQKSRVTVFGNPQLRLDFNQKRAQLSQKSQWQLKLFHNQYLYYGRIILVNYFKSFNFDFLFRGGGTHPWHKTAYFPHFYFIISILSLTGFLFFIKNPHINKEKKIFLILFTVLAPIPSAITIDAPHATRLLNLFFLITLFSGTGLYWLIKKTKPVALFCSLLLMFNLFQFTKSYFIDYKQNPPTEILPGLKEVVFYLKGNEAEYERVIFGNMDDGNYAYLLFYLKYPPFDFINNVKRYSPDTSGLEWVEWFDKYTFVENPVIDDKFKTFYIMKEEKSTGKIVYQAKNKINNQVYYNIVSNF